MAKTITIKTGTSQKNNDEKRMQTSAEKKNKTIFIPVQTESKQQKRNISSADKQSNTLPYTIELARPSTQQTENERKNTYSEAKEEKNEPRRVTNNILFEQWKAATEKRNAEEKAQQERDKLQKQLKELNQNAAYISTTAASDEYEQKRKDTLNQLHALDEAEGREARSYDGRERAGALFGSWGKGTGASYTNAAANIIDIINEVGSNANGTDREIADLEAQAARAQAAYDEAVQQYGEAGATFEKNLLIEAQQKLDAKKAQYASMADRARAAYDKTKATAANMYDVADKLLTQSEEDMARAKVGTSALGSFALDAAKTGLDIGLDTAISALGVPGLANMAARVYGSEAQQARLQGDDAQTAAAKGLKSALIEVVTEKIAGPFEKAYGKSALSSSINKAVDKLNASGLLKWAADTAGEGFEEGMSDVLNTVADHIMGWDSGENSVWGDIAADKDEIMYDMLLGAFVGAFGATGNAIGAKANTTSTAQAQPQVEQAAPVQTAPTQAETTQQAAANNAPSQLNIDNGSARAYNNTNVNVANNIGGMTNVASGSVEADSGRVSGVYRGRDTIHRGEEKSSGAGVGSGFVLLSPQAKDTLAKRGVAVVETQDVSNDKPAFSAALDAARANDSVNGWAVTPKSVAELEESGAKLIMSANGTTGLAIAPDGDIEAVFANKAAGAPKGATKTTIPQAVANGGTKLDCYGEGLVTLYAKYGFVPVARVKFNPEYANQGWDTSKGTPDIFFMMHNGDSADTVVQKMGTYHRYTENELNALPAMDYDEAYSYRDSLLANSRKATDASQPAGDNLTPPTAQNVKQGDSDALNSAVNYNSRETAAEAPAQAQKNTAPTQETGNGGSLIQRVKNLLSGANTTVKRSDAISNMNFGEISAAIESGMVSRDELPFATVSNTTPQVLINQAGAQNLPIIMDYSNVYLSTKKSGDLKGHYHDLGSDVMAEIPKMLKSPVLMVRLGNGRINEIIQLNDKKGNPVLVSLELSAIKNLGGSFNAYNLVVTAFGAKSNYINNLVSNPDNTVLINNLPGETSQVNPQRNELPGVINEATSGSYTTSATTSGVVTDNSANTFTSETAEPVARSDTSLEVSDDISSDTSIRTDTQNVKQNFEAEGNTAPMQETETEAREQVAVEENNTAFSNAGVNGEYSVERNEAGNVTIRINDSLIADKPKSEWAGVVKRKIQEIFANGLNIPRGTVFSNKKGRGEFTNGSYTRMLERAAPELYKAKMGMAAGTGAMVENAENVRPEAPTHARNDDIVGFNRGNIRVIVEGAGYTGDVLTAIYSDGKEVFFDVNNIAKEKADTTSERYAAEKDGFSQADVMSVSDDISSDTSIRTDTQNVKQNFEENGAAREPFTPTYNEKAQPAKKEKLSRFWENTLQRTETAAGVTKDVGEPLFYLPKTEKQSLAEAASRLSSDRQGTVENLVSAEAWSGTQVDSAATIASDLYKEAQKTGNYEAYTAWRKVMDNHVIEGGRGIQALAKYSRETGENALSTIASMIAQSNLTPEQRQTLINKVGNYAARFDEITHNGENVELGDGEKAELISLIEDMARERGTWTFFKNLYSDLLKKQDGEYLKKYAYKQMLGMGGDTLSKATLAEKVKAYQTMAQLSSVATFKRNIGGNVSFGAVDTLVQDGLGVAIDHLLSKATGKRTVALDKGWFSSAARIGAIDAMQKSILEVAGDVDGNQNRYDMTAGRAYKMSGDPVERFMSRWQQLLNYSLTTSDKFSRGAIESEQARGLNALKESGLTYEEIGKLAKSAADYRLFQNQDGIAYRLSKGAHDVLNLVGFGGKVNGVTREGGFGVGDLVNTYPGVPANLGVKALEYSPANIAKGGVELIKVIIDAKSGKLDVVKQQQAVMDLSRGLAGLPAIALAGALSKAGLIKNWDDEDDPDIRAQNAAEGKTGIQINLTGALRYLKGETGEITWVTGDKVESIGWLEPINAFLAIGSLMAREGDDANTWDYAGDWVEGSIQGLLEIPVMSNIADIIDTFQYSTADNIDGKVAEAATQYAGNVVASFIPSFVRAAAKASDEYYRDTSGDTAFDRSWNQIKNAVPGLRQTLDVKLDNFGNPKEYGGTPLTRLYNAFSNPGDRKTITQSEASKTIESLYKETGNADIYPDRKGVNKISVNGENVSLTTKEKREYQRIAGNTSENLIESLKNDPLYKKASPEQRVELIKELNSYAKDEAKVAWGETKGVEVKSSYEGMREAGIADIPDYMLAKQVLSTAGSATDKADYSFIDDILSNFGRLSTESRTELQNAPNLNVNKLLYADNLGIDSKAWYKAHNAAKKNQEATGSSKDWATAEAIGKLGGSSKDKLARLSAEIPPDGTNYNRVREGYTRPSIIRRYDAAIKSGVDFDVWTDVEKIVEQLQNGNTDGWQCSKKFITQALADNGYTQEEIDDVWAIKNATDDYEGVNYLDDYWGQLIENAGKAAAEK